MGLGFGLLVSWGGPPFLPWLLLVWRRRFPRGVGFWLGLGPGFCLLVLVVGIWVLCSKRVLGVLSCVRICCSCFSLNSVACGLSF